MPTPDNAARPARREAPERHDLPDLWSDGGRPEPSTYRLDRSYHELLQELRVSQAGVQVLLTFLLWAAFSPAFGAITAYQRQLYVVALVSAILALALLIAPTCANRVTAHPQLRAVTFTLASRCAVGGLGLLFASLSCVMVLILDVVLGSALAVALGFTTVVWFAVWWYIVPFAVRRRHRRAPTAPVASLLAVPPSRAVPPVPGELHAGTRAAAASAPRSELTCGWREGPAGTLVARWRQVTPAGRSRSATRPGRDR